MALRCDSCGKDISDKTDGLVEWIETANGGISEVRIIHGEWASPRKASGSNCHLLVISHLKYKSMNLDSLDPRMVSVLKLNDRIYGSN